MVLDSARLARRLARARSARNRGTRYRLGRGGFDPAAPLPHDARAECDCSGFVAWTLEMRRDQLNARKPWSRFLPWIETTLVRSDAIGAQRVFVRIPQAVPGSLVVVGDRAGSEGHIGVVATVTATGEVGDVVDCSSGRSRSVGQAITERDGGWFRSRPDRVYCVLREDLQ